MVDRLHGVATWAFAGWGEVPFVQGAGCFSHFGSCSVEGYPFFPLKVGSCRKLFDRGLGGPVRVVIPFVPGLESADGRYIGVEAVYCSEAPP